MFRVIYISRNTAKKLYPELSTQSDSWFLRMERTWIEKGFNDILIGSINFYEFCMEQL